MQVEKPEVDRAELAWRMGRRIATWRKDNDISQTTLAKRMNLSQSHVSGLECGRSLPNSWGLYCLARAMGVSMDWLLSEPDA